MSEQVEKALGGLIKLVDLWRKKTAEYSDYDNCADELFREALLLRTRLEKVLEVGQAMSDAIVGGYTDEWDQASDRWIAALAELAGKESGK